MRWNVAEAKERLSERIRQARAVLIGESFQIEVPERRDRRATLCEVARWSFVTSMCSPSSCVASRTRGWWAGPRRSDHEP